MNKLEIAFVGAGNMATSLILGLISQGRDPSSLLACDPSAEQLDRLASQLPEGTEIQLSRENAAIHDAAIVILAVKPQAMQDVAREVAGHLAPGTLVVSIAAGVSVSALESWLGEQAIVRCMPNTPALVKMGASGLYANPRVTPDQRRAAEDILNAVGISSWVDREELIDSVTALSGSGPAYFFLLMETMVEAGEELGLSKKVAAELVIQTCAGAAELAAQSEDSLADLRKKVTSPGGTTERALESFRKDDFNATVKRALRACAARAKELESMLENKS